MKEDMPAIDISAIDALKEIKGEQDVIHDRLDKMESMRDRVSDAVFEKVRGEHEAKLAELSEKAEPLRDKVREEYGKLKSMMDQLQAEVDEQNLVKEELELRHAIGEFDEDTYNDKVKAWEVGHVEKQAELEGLQDMKKLFLSVFESEADLEGSSDATEGSTTAIADDAVADAVTDDAEQNAGADAISDESGDSADEPEEDVSTEASFKPVADTTTSEAAEDADADRITTEDLEDTPDPEAFVNPEDDLDDIEAPAEMLSAEDLDDEPEELDADSMIEDDPDESPSSAGTADDAVAAEDDAEEPDAWAAAEASSEGWAMSQGGGAGEDPDATVLQAPNPFMAEDVDEGATIQYNPDQLAAGVADADDDQDAAPASTPGTMAMPLPGMSDDDVDDADSTILMNADDLPQLPPDDSDAGEDQADSTVLMNADDLPQLPTEDEDGIDDHINDLDDQLPDDTADTDDAIAPPPIPASGGDVVATEIMDMPRFDQPMSEHDAEMTTPLPPPEPEDVQTTDLDDPESEAADAYATESMPSQPEDEPETMMMNQGEIADAVGDDTEGTMIISNPKITSLNNSTEGQVTTLGMGTTSIGRSPDNDIHITEDRVSRKHAQITFGPGGYAIYDLNSENGTYVNGNRVREHFLSDGDIIMVGTYKFLYRDR